MNISKQNKIIIIVLGLVIFPLLAYFSWREVINPAKIISFLEVPGMILGVLLLIALNLPMVQRRMSKREGSKSILPSANETVINSRPRIVVWTMFNFVPLVYLFSKVTITSERLVFGLLPFLSIPSMSLFYKDTGSTYYNNQYILAVSTSGSYLLLLTSKKEFVRILFRDRKTLVKIESLIKDAVGSVSR
jgi:hypothetical protein